MWSVLTPELSPFLYDDLVRAALREDIGSGDLTSDLLIPSDALGEAALITRQAGVLCGLGVAETVFRMIDPRLTIERVKAEGARVAPKDVLARVRGPLRGMLTGERVALNLLQRLSGIATLTARFVAAMAGTRAFLADTRKTTPGLRVLERYAVRVGGGRNHRYGLDAAVMIKDNHRAAVGSLAAAVATIKGQVGHAVVVEVEVDTLAQLEEALSSEADVVLLDNMSLENLRAAVAMNAGRKVLEASGGVSLETVGAIAATGVDVVSAGVLTHGAASLDIGLDIEPTPALS